MTLAVAILGTISAVIGLAARLIKPRCKPTAKQLAEKRIHQARTASATGNADAANAIVERQRTQKQLLVPIAALLLLTGCTGGCKVLPISWQGSVASPAPDDLPPATIVIPANRHQYPVTNDLGIVGWFVPNAVHAEMMEALILVEYYRKEIKK